MKFSTGTEGQNKFSFLYLKNNNTCTILSFFERYPCYMKRQIWTFTKM